ncbi:hypothetical protein BKA70DRAFT_1262187 [Coprinopsis sp. MPI-PUGE-AT-0042]|nr:hypothetical protein BKA70DRAFT_1262187 [Coprinopsis sp. MPI-PUGE-AT-0042]
MATTMTDPLAARLNQLAQANEEGLLSDDEYRLLRQGAFEQFVGGAPTERPSASPCPPPSFTGRVKQALSSPSSTPSKRSLFPRLFRSKHSDLPPLRIDPPPPLKKHAPSNSLNDNAPISSKDIQQTISSTQSELERLTEAFDTLEQSLLRRLAKERARRLPATTPISVDTLIEGREWREHRKIPSVASSPLLKDIDSAHSPSLSPRPSFSAAVSPMRLDPLPRPPLSASASTPSHPSTSRSSLSRKTSLSSHFTMKKFSRNRVLSPSPSHAETPESTSPLRSQFWAEASVARPLARKPSVSSISSHGTTVSTLASFSLSPFKTRSRNRMTSSTTATSVTHSSGSSQAHNASGSTVHLPVSPTGWSSSRPSLDASPPRRLKHSRSATMGSLSAPSERSEGDGDWEWDDPEAGDSSALLQQLHEMRQRRKEMTERYEGRVEYLRAKLRSAELHEKVRKK